MKLYNTKTRQIEEFHPIEEKKAKIYTCGPTVYGFQHIGNYASYIYWDLLIRALTLDGYEVTRVLNLTDVGHLTSDGDTGEDKMEKGAKKEGKDVWQIADFYIEDFLKNFKKLNLTLPSKICRATDYIEQDKKSVDEMIKNGFTYETSDGIYFDTEKFTDYAKFANLNLEGLKAGARVDYSSEKKNPSDFAVWKFIKDGENHAMRWDYLGRPGYPGWHLECSTIIHSELGEPIDIHTGGIDHIPVHHTNEIAQTYALSKKDLAKYWLHCNFITIEGEKVSKSLGNTYTLKDLEEKGYSALDYKMWVLSGNYRSTRNFTFEELDASHNRRLNWRNKIVHKYQPIIFDMNQKVDMSPCEKLLELVSNNLNSAEAFAYIDTFDENTPLTIWDYVDQLFGLDLLKDTKDISMEQKSLIKDREEARKNKDWVKSDEIRKELEKSGITIKDTAEGPIWQYMK